MHTAAIAACRHSLCLALLGLLLGATGAGATEERKGLEKVQDSFLKLVCGKTAVADNSACARMLGDAGQGDDGARVRQLAAHFIVLTFAEAGTRALEEHEDRGVLAPALLQRIRSAEAELHEACSVLAWTPAARKAAIYPLERADALIAVADVVKAGIKPTARRLRGLASNPVSLLAEVGDVLEDGMADAIYGSASRRGFVVALDIIAPGGKVDGKELQGAWQAVADRLEVSCKNLARLGGAQEDSAPVCKVLKPCAELQP